TQLLRETRLVLRRPGRVVATPRNVRAELAHRLEVHGLRVIEQSLLTEPRLGDHSAPFRARGDEVQLMPSRDELLEHGRAILIDLELAEERALVELHPEAVALLRRDTRETGNDLVPRRVLLH